MTEDFADYLEKKWSKKDKRGDVTNHSDVHNSSRVLDLPGARRPEELRTAQVQLAVLAFEHPDLATDKQRELWLEEVLEALDLRRHISGVTPTAESPCSPHTGTVRGYNIHLRGYTAPCTKCKNVGEEAELARLRSMGLEMEGETWLVTKP